MVINANKRRNAGVDLQFAGFGAFSARRRASPITRQRLRVYAADVAAPKSLCGHAGDRYRSEPR